METLNAIKGIKQELPDVKTILGVSNISFGLNTYARRVLNSVFMKEAVDYGLDMAIVNYAKIYPLYKIPQIEVDLARKLIYYDKSAGDPLQIYMQHFTGLDKQPQVEAAPLESLVSRRQAEALHHQRRKGAGRWRAEADAGADSGRRSARNIRRWRSSIRSCWTA